MFDVPILLIIFNRPDTTKQVFEKIREIKPKQLFVAADGSREDKENEYTLCQETRDIVINGIDWDCEIKTLFQDKNLGCGLNPSGAITWFFEHVEEGIILEDDCLPSLSFFSFCRELLIKYRFDEQIYVIGGNNFQNKKRGFSSYYFSAYGHIWGWATWRRAWSKFDYELKDFDSTIFSNKLKSYFPIKEQQEYWIKIFTSSKRKPVDHIWDFQWTITQWYNNAINIVPNVNLVKNIGFGENATHTKHKSSNLYDKPTIPLLKIKHPSSKKINYKADTFTFNHIFKRLPVKESIFMRIKLKLKLIFPFLSKIKFSKQKN